MKCDRRSKVIREVIGYLLWIDPYVASDVANHFLEGSWERDFESGNPVLRCETTEEKIRADDPADDQKREAT